jgi:hypothetical protein
MVDVEACDWGTVVVSDAEIGGGNPKGGWDNDE